MRALIARRSSPDAERMRWEVGQFTTMPIRVRPLEFVVKAAWIVGIVAVLGCAGGAGDGPPPDITGVWAVTMRYEDGSCPDVTAGSQASMWTVNRDADGAYAITVQGDDKLPALMGKEEGSDIVLVGLVDSYPTVSTQWRLVGSATELKGRALQTRSAPKAYKVKSRYGESEKDVMCTVIWATEATKQGK